MKRKLILWFLALALLLPLVSVPISASRDEYYDDFIEPMTIYDHFYISRSDSGSLMFIVDSRNRAMGISMGLYPVQLTGQESKDQLKAMAKELVEDEVEPELPHNQFSTLPYCDRFEYKISGEQLNAGSYLFVAYLYDYSMKDGRLENLVRYPDLDTLYVTDVHVVNDPVPCTGARFFLCDQYGENREYVTALELELDIMSAVFLCAERTPYNGTGAFYLDFIPLDEACPVDPFRMFPTYMTCGYPIWVSSCGTGTLGAVWRTSNNDTEYQIGPFPITVTVPCKPDENNVEVTRERTATQPGQLTGPCKSCGEPATMDWAPIFTDTDPHEYYAPAVDYCYEKQLFRGISEDKFSPTLAMSRGMVVTVLYRLAGSPSTTGLQSAFTDVEESQYYTEPVKWAAANGIVNGMGNGKFQPNTNVSREQLAAILYRYAQLTGMDMTVSGGGLTKFTDRSTISDYAATPMAWAVDRGLINGITTTTLHPRGNALRAQVATIIYRYVNAVVDPA